MDRAALEPYIRDLADRLGLKDWEIILKNEACADDCCATINPTDGRKVAYLRLAKDWNDVPADDKRQTIVHELLHCHQAAALNLVRLDLPRQMSQSTYDVFEASHRRAMEYANDALACVLAPLMPPYPDDIR